MAKIVESVLRFFEPKVQRGSYRKTDTGTIGRLVKKISNGKFEVAIGFGPETDKPIARGIIKH